MWVVTAGPEYQNKSVLIIRALVHHIVRSATALEIVEVTPDSAQKFTLRVSGIEEGYATSPLAIEKEALIFISSPCRPTGLFQEHLLVLAHLLSGVYQHLLLQLQAFVLHPNPAFHLKSYQNQVLELSFS